MKHPIRELLGDALLVGSGAAITWMFFMIHLRGYTYIKEDIMWIRYTELAMGIIIFIVGVERFIQDLRRK